MVQLYDHQGNLPAGLYPLLMLDMWEHAFRLQYRNVKADYVTAWWNIINWPDVIARFTAARGVLLHPPPDDEPVMTAPPAARGRPAEMPVVRQAGRCWCRAAMSDIGMPGAAALAGLPPDRTRRLLDRLVSVHLLEHNLGRPVRVPRPAGRVRRRAGHPDRTRSRTRCGR